MKAKALPQNVIERMDPKDRKDLGVQTLEERSKKLDAKSEKEIQIQVEAYLVHLGYWPRTDAYLDGRTPPSGWYIHLHNTKRNPYLLDLLIWNIHTNKSPLELELKNGNTKLEPCQEKILLADKKARLGRSAEEACGIVKGWHEKQTGDGT